MAAITKIIAHVQTADVTNATGEGRLYLGVAGREFVLDLAGRVDLNRGDTADYVLGEDANVENTRYNDPRLPHLDTDDLDRYPVFLRFEQSGAVEPAWCLERAWVRVNPQGPVTHRFDNPAMVGTADNQRIWLSDAYGKTLHLKRYDD